MHQLAQPNSDRRGASDVSPNVLSFTHNGRTYPRTAQYVEELRSNGEQMVGLRFWIFVMDPDLNFAAALADVATSNVAIYHANPGRNQRFNPGRPPPETISRRDRYVSHAKVTNEADIVGLLGSVVSTGADSVDAHEYPERRRAVGNLRSAIMNSTTIQTQDSPAALPSILSPALAIMFHSTSVCPIQRDITGYCLVGDCADAPAAADAGGQDSAPDRSTSSQDEELEALALLGGGGGGDDAMAAEEADVEAGEEAPLLGLGEQDVGDACLAAAEGLASVKFVSFPHPERVQAIPSEFFGEALLNVPLLRCYSEEVEREDEAASEEGRPSLPIMFRVLSGEYELWEGMVDDERLEFLEAEHMATVDTYYDASSPLYFELDRSALEMDKEAQEEALYKIYRAAQHQQDEWRANDVLPKVRDQIRSQKPLVVQFDATQARINADGRMEMVYNHRERPLRETVSMEAMTKHDLEFFARVDDVLALRIDNHAAQNEILREYPPNSNEYYHEIREWRRVAAERYFNVAMESENVSPAWKKQRDWFRSLPPSKQWARHELTHPDLSFYANTMLLQVQRFNQIFHGASTQTLFLLIQRVVFGTPMYKWDLRPNLLIYGRGGDGKSHPLTAVEAMSAPGLVKCYSHITEKAFSVNKPYSDETFCMHEAPGFMLGIDDHGHEVPSNPILKDRLIRQRSGTMAFGTSESGERVRIEQEVMVMGDAILITNDTIPSDKKALTQRFILYAVHHTRREGFKKGDYAILSADEVARSIDADHLHAARLFSFYCSLVFQMCKAYVIPDPSTDGGAKVLREVLDLFGQRTGLENEDGRTRTKVLDVMAITAVMNAVSVGLFSRLSDEYRYETRPDGSKDLVAFDPMFIIDHVMPRMYATDEVIMDTINLMDFLFEPHVHYDVLQAVVAQLNGNVHRGEVLTKANVDFLHIANPRYRRNGNRHYTQRQQPSSRLTRAT
ncbi:MAG: hypothetical protein LC650_04290 [Actinobacteria bacterium]|nr:hypothetical protein [Actinomycetota bacterium]